MEMIEYQVNNIYIPELFEEREYLDEIEETRNRPWENPANPIDAGLEGTYPTVSGINMDARKSMTLAAVWQAVSLISGDIAKTRMVLCRRNEDGRTKEWLWDHPLSDLVYKRPNFQLDPVTFWRRTTLHFLLYGNAYIWVNRDRMTGEPIELLHLLPDRTWNYRDPTDPGVMPAIIYSGSPGNTRQHFLVPEQDVIHLQWNHDVPYEVAALPTWQMAADSWALGLAQEAFASGFFRRGGRMGGILELPAAMTKGSKDKVEEGFRRTYENTQQAFKTVILRDNAKFHQGQYNFQETQLVEGQEETARQVARWFNLPPDKLGVAGASSYNSKQEDNRNYHEQTLGVIFRQFQWSCNRKLLRPNQLRRHFFDHDTRDMLAPDPPAKMDMAMKGFSSNLMTKNESREMLGLSPVDDGDKFMEELYPDEQPMEMGAQEGNVQGAGGGENGGNRFDELRIMIPLIRKVREYNQRRSAGAARDYLQTGAKEFRDEEAFYGLEIIDDFERDIVEALCEGIDVEHVCDKWESKYANTHRPESDRAA